MDKPQKNARIYLRVSTQEQSLERQEALIDYVKKEGFYIAGVYREKASGTQLERPILDQLINDLQNGDIVIAENIDRISRLPLPEAEKLIQRIKDKGALLSIPNVIDLSDIKTDSSLANIVLDTMQSMLLKIALQISRDDYLLRRKRQAEGIATAKKQGRLKGKQGNLEQYKQIIKLRENHSITETAKIVKCSIAHVKKVTGNKYKVLTDNLHTPPATRGQKA